MLQVLGKASSINVRKVMWTCAELGLPFARENWGSGFQSTHDPAFLALNPNAMVPVIKDEDFVLWESNSIIRYLAGREGNTALYPTEPRARARVDQWLDWQATDLNKSWTYPFLSLVRHSPAHQDPQALTEACGQWAANMAILEGQLQASGGHVSGEAFSLADIAIGLSVNRWFQTPLQHPHLPAVSAYYERLSQRPGYLLHGRNGTP
ncbi:glutathione S-transferase family protein [Pseudomonas sp. Irchel 3E20]|uniref:glutathione S-transferase family protein n=1 Tax=Pseudomonas sp. Irchel 3E20 TaxID=2008983 RepID=UPI000BA4D6F5|nr:glutathione S-transferase [Pseudomonas sp. Irchel 3E20]